MIKKHYVYSELFVAPQEFEPIAGSTYIYAFTKEDRSKLADALIPRCGNYCKFVGVEYLGSDIIRVENDSDSYSLRGSQTIGAFVEKYIDKIAYLDISGLNARISSALIIALFKRNITTYVIYAEPATYRLDKFRNEGVLVDLAEKVDGISPLPGLIRFIDNDKKIFVPLLGFEGARFTQIYEDVSPLDEDIYPVVGLPGYRLEYPFVTLFSNKPPLFNTQSWANIQYVMANSVVDVYLKLLEIHERNSDTKIDVAPIGTKPHAIGAILFAMKYDKRVELIYDNPKRNEKRTDGIGKIIVCNATKLVNEN